MASRRSRALLTLLSFAADSVSDVISERTGTRFFDELALGQLGSMRRSYAVGAGLLLAAGVAIAMTRMGRGTLSSAVGDLAGAQPGWIVVAASSFVIGLLASSAGWRVGLRACGGSTGFTQISARYAIGSSIRSRLRMWEGLSGSDCSPAPFPGTTGSGAPAASLLPSLRRALSSSLL